MRGAKSSAPLHDHNRIREYHVTRGPADENLHPKPSNNPARRIGGVLGGMGPLATVDFLTKVINLTPAPYDQQHIPLIVHQVPQIPDRGVAIMGGSDEPFQPMLLGLQRLAAAGAEFAVIPCNSAHHWYERLTSAQPLRILHIADAVRDEMRYRSLDSRRLCILATRGTHRSGIYHTRLGDITDPIVPDEATQQLIDNAIAEVKAGQLALAASDAHEAASQLLSIGAETLVLACTELPVALRDSPLQAFCIDSTLALARRCVEESCSSALIPGKLNAIA